MELADLGQGGVRVSRLALGCWQFSGDATWGKQDRGDSIATVHAALASGINLFDTAEMYGDGLSERILGEALKGRRASAVIATKVSRRPMTAAAVRAACEESLDRLGTHWIDLYQVHFWDRDVPMEECIRALLDLRQAGKIRAIGVCNSGVCDLAKMSGLVRPVSNQMPYSLLWRAIEYAILPDCRSRGIGILAYSPLAQGLLAGRFSSADQVPAGRARTRHFSGSRPQTRHGEAGKEAETFSIVGRVRALCDDAGVSMACASLRWLLAQDGVTAALAGARNPGQVEENARAAATSMPQWMLAELSRLTDGLKEGLGPNPDLWQAEARAW